LEWGPKYKYLKKLEAKSGKKPPALESRIEVSPELQYVYGYFSVLHTQRAQGFSGPESLNITDIVNYLTTHGLKGTRKQTTLELILAMDRTFISYYASKKQPKAQ
jgi:hypothetical protein